MWDKTLHVDGLKTGHTASAGFNIIASATEGDRRLIAVVMGGKSSKGREEQARKLLTWGLRDFATVHLFSAGQSTGKSRFGTARITGYRSVARKSSRSACREARRTS